MDSPTIEIFLAKRNNDLQFFPGLFSGIGGKLERTDYEIANEFYKKKMVKKDKTELAYLVSSWRELLEEVEIFYYDSNNKDLKKGILEFTRKKNGLNLQELISQFDLKLEKFLLNDFNKAGFRSTPEFTNVQFRTQFFFLHLKTEKHFPRIRETNPEFSTGIWDQPKNFFEKFKKNIIQTSPPVLGVIRALTKHPLVIEDHNGRNIPNLALELLNNNDYLPIGLQVPIEAHPGIEIIPFKSFTRPPATTTNLVVIGDEKKIIVDPGTHKPSEKKRLELIIDNWLDNGDEILFQVLTHHHKDHWDASMHLREKYDLPIAFHREFKSYLNSENLIHDIDLTDDYEVNLGMDNFNDIKWKIKIKNLPGHSKDHLVLLDQRFNALVSGDIISGIGTVIIEDLEDYMNSLEYLRGVNVSTIFPGHGPIITDGSKVINDYISHRKVRGQMILQTIKNNRKITISEITKLVYKDIPESFLIVAEEQVKIYMKYFLRKNLVKYNEMRQVFELN
jgi:glyoxylase-like metal-dependent hydrolase (beta-lactamase superfamily II)